MPRSSKQKQKLLYLQKLMLEKTDEEHGLTVNEIIEELAKDDISAERRSIYEDLEILGAFGLDICKIRTNTVRYYVGSRDFQIAELKLLVDAIQSSKFITRKKSLELIEKIGHLVSVNEAAQLRREVYVTNRVKTPNEQIYYNVDKLYNAISGNKRISFRYYRWEINPELGGRKIIKTARRSGALYRVSPWALCWDDENYYLIAFDSEAQIIKHYRVDKMESISLLDEVRDGGRQFESFNPARYAKSVFSMFGGQEAQVTLSVDNRLIGVIVDRFGSDVFITREDSGDRFRITVPVVLSPQFYAWVFGMGRGVRIISPEAAVEGFRARLAEFAE